jgi:beta-phosphoglucomutase-like phosphatase (HAD superfamily)
MAVSMTATPTVLLDLDGTLVDSVYHHVLAWDEALVAAGYHVPLWRIHAGIGMGGDRIVPWLLGGQVEDIDALKSDHKERFLTRADTLRATDGATALIDDLSTREVPFTIATSAGGAVREALLGALGLGELPGVDADAVDSPKPAPDLLLAACDDLGCDPSVATLIGDSPWDAEAARRVGIRSIAVRCGGFGEDDLRSAGAIDVARDPRELIGRL